MHVVTSITIKAAQTAVWRILTDPAITSACMPGLVDWETLVPEQRFRIVVSWGENSNGSSIRIPAVIEWTHLLPPQEMHIHTQVFFGSNTIDITGEAQLVETAADVTVLEVSSEIETLNPVMTQMANNAAAKVLRPFFRCLRQHAERI